MRSFNSGDELREVLQFLDPGTKVVYYGVVHEVVDVRGTHCLRFMNEEVEMNGQDKPTAPPEESYGLRILDRFEKLVAISRDMERKAFRLHRNLLGEKEGTGPEKNDAEPVNFMDVINVVQEELNVRLLMVDELLDNLRCEESRVRSDLQSIIEDVPMICGQCRTSVAQTSVYPYCPKCESIRQKRLRELALLKRVAHAMEQYDGSGEWNWHKVRKALRKWQEFTGRKALGFAGEEDEREKRLAEGNDSGSVQA